MFVERAEKAEPLVEAAVEAEPALNEDEAPEPDETATIPVAFRRLRAASSRYLAISSYARSFARGFRMKFQAGVRVRQQYR